MGDGALLAGGRHRARQLLALPLHDGELRRRRVSGDLSPGCGGLRGAGDARRAGARACDSPWPCGSLRTRRIPGRTIGRHGPVRGRGDGDDVLPGRARLDPRVRRDIGLSVGRVRRAGQWELRHCARLCGHTDGLLDTGRGRRRDDRFARRSPGDREHQQALPSRFCPPHGASRALVAFAARRRGRRQLPADVRLAGADAPSGAGGGWAGFSSRSASAARSW